MKCAGCGVGVDATNTNVVGLIVCPHCGRAHAQSQAVDNSVVDVVTENAFREQPNPAERSIDAVGFEINPYAPPLLPASRIRRPPRKFDKEFCRGIGCLAGGVVLTTIGVNFLLFGDGMMPMFVIVGGPVLMLVGLIYLFFWYSD